MPLDLTFWGVRGSIPTPVAENLGFGGNTSCVAIRYGDQPLLIFDAGSGLRGLGNTLMPALGSEQVNVHLFLTHFHWDHIQGFPYFAPIYHPRCGITVHSSLEPAALERTMSDQMQPPYYPVALPATQATVGYERVESDGTGLGDLLIRPFRLNHPNGATGYRIESPVASIVYATDHEHGDPSADAGLREYAGGADILIYDSQYTPQEYEQRRGWGHSTWRKAVALAQEAGVKQLILFHHDPLRTDQQLAAIVRDAQGEFENTMAATEGWSTRF